MTNLETNRTLLRTSTQEMHAAAEQAWFTENTFQSLAHYRGFLSALLYCHQALGLVAARCLNDQAAILAEQDRIACLRVDLGEAGTRILSPNTPMGIDYAWGVCYALNGSSLGASMILKSGALPKDWPRTYLQSLQTYAKSGTLANFFTSLNGARLDIETTRQGAAAVFNVLHKTGHCCTDQFPIEIPQPIGFFTQRA